MGRDEESEKNDDAMKQNTTTTLSASSASVSVSVSPWAFLVNKWTSLSYKGVHEVGVMRSTLYQLLTNLLSSYKQLETANQAKRHFLRYIFHEIRVPFNAMVLGIDQVATTHIPTQPMQPSCTLTQPRTLTPVCSFWVCMRVCVYMYAADTGSRVVRCSVGVGSV